MGPPGSGKSVFLKALGGRLMPSRELRASGKGVRYNGLSTAEFCVERAIGFVDQYDDREWSPSEGCALRGQVLAWCSADQPGSLPGPGVASAEPAEEHDAAAQTYMAR